MMNARLSETHKIVNALPPVDVGVGGKSGEWVNLKLYNKITILFELGNVASGSALTLRQATNINGGSAKALPFGAKNLKVCADTTAGDDLVATTPSGTNTHTPANQNNQLVAIELNASELDGNGGFCCVQGQIAADSGTIASMTYILGGARYAQATPPTAVEEELES